VERLRAILEELSAEDVRNARMIVLRHIHELRRTLEENERRWPDGNEMQVRLAHQIEMIYRLPANLRAYADKLEDNDGLD
jgi:hypothetical protein